MPVDVQTVPLGILLHAQPVIQLLPARGHRLQLLVVPGLLGVAQALLQDIMPCLIQLLCSVQPRISLPYHLCNTDVPVKGLS